MNTNYTLTIKTARHSQYSDEYDGREGLIKAPYKMIFQQSEIRNGQLASYNDELRDTIEALNAKIAELEAENRDLTEGLLKDYRKEVKREEMYRTQRNTLERARKEIQAVKKTNRELLACITRLKSQL